MLDLGQDPTRLSRLGWTPGMVYLAPVLPSAMATGRRSSPAGLMRRDAVVVQLPRAPGPSADALQALHALWDTPHMGMPDVVAISGWYRLEALQAALQKATGPLTLLVEDYDALLPEPQRPIILRAKRYIETTAVIEFDPAALEAQAISRAVEALQNAAAEYTRAAVRHCKELASLAKSDQPAELARALMQVVLDEHHEPAWLEHLKRLTAAASAADTPFEGAEAFFAALATRAQGAVGAVTALNLIARLQKGKKWGDEGLAAALFQVRLSPGPELGRPILRAALQTRINAQMAAKELDALEQTLALTASLTPSIRDTAGCQSFGSLLYKGLKTLLEEGRDQIVADICAQVPDRFTAIKRMAVRTALDQNQPDTALQNWRVLLEQNPKAAREMQENMPSIGRLRDERRQEYTTRKRPHYTGTHIAVLIKTVPGRFSLLGTVNSVRFALHEQNFRFYISDEAPLDEWKEPLYDALRAQGHHIEIAPAALSVTVARNRLLDALRNEDFVLRLDDDFELGGEFNIHAMLSLLSHPDIDFCSDIERQIGAGKGIASGACRIQSGPIVFSETGDAPVIDMLDDDDWSFEEHDGFEFARAEYMRNLILLKRHCFDTVRWNPDLEFIGEHTDFYLQLSRAGLRGAFTPDSIHLHRDDLKGRAVAEDQENKWRHDKTGAARTHMEAVFQRIWNGYPKTLRRPPAAQK